MLQVTRAELLKLMYHPQIRHRIHTRKRPWSYFWFHSGLVMFQPLSRLISMTTLLNYFDEVAANLSRCKKPTSVDKFIYAGLCVIRHLLTEMPLSEVPLHINSAYKYVPIIAAWRLSIGK